MKNIILSLALAMALLLPATAQNTKFGILAGVNFQNLNGKNTLGDKLNYDLLTGFHAGVNVLIPLVPDIYFQPQLQFTVSGASIKNTTPEAKIKLNYIQLPLNLVYRGQLGGGFVLLGFGPYLGYAISGKYVAGDLKQDIQFKNTVDAGSPLSATYFKAFDTGAGIFAGYEMANGIFLQLDTQLGLMNINPDDKRFTNNKAVVKNTGFGISAGYRF